MDEVYEFLKSIFPVSVILASLLICGMPIQYTEASSEFTMFRMQQFDFYGSSYGSRGGGFTLEAKSVKTWSTARDCVIARLKELTVTSFVDIAQRAGALLIVLPKELLSLSANEKETIIELEQTMLSRLTTIPVYFLQWNQQLQNVVNNMDMISSSSDRQDIKKESAFSVIISSVFAMGYQIEVPAPVPSSIANAQIPIIQGQLEAYEKSSVTPTVVLVTHYDAQNVVPELSFGADSNGSGLVMMLELARMLSKLYSKTTTRPRFNIAFVLSGGGKFSYLGSKKWIEDQTETFDATGSNYPLQNVAFVMCLDTLGDGDTIYTHVSKPPKNGSAVDRFFKELESVAAKESVKIDLVHKKINLADEMLAWEHERFSMKRMPAFTLSTLQNHKDHRRRTMFDVKENLNLETVYTNTRIVAETLTRMLYDLSKVDVLSTYNVERESIKLWIDSIATTSRSMQLITSQDNLLLQSLFAIMRSYLNSCSFSFAVADRGDPEFVFYDGTKTVAHMYSVKPAVFDLILTLMIGVYLTVVYHIIQRFPVLYSSMTVAASSSKVH